MANKEKIFKDLEHQRQTNDLTFSDVENVFEKNNFDYQGNQVIYSNKNHHIVFWSGWNEEACKLFDEYRSKYTLTLLPVSLIYYLMGRMLNLPIVKTNSMKVIKNYKQDHWLPTRVVTQKEWDEA